MVIGYDTYHDARQRKAVGAFVASITPNFTRYYSSVKIHENNEEISPSFKDHLFGALKYVFIILFNVPVREISSLNNHEHPKNGSHATCYHSYRQFYIANNKQLPEKIFVYRDGVGAGDIARLKETEIAALKVVLIQ